jgi:hypothetical protein
MKMRDSILLCLLVLAVGLSCRMIDTLGGGNKAGTVDDLWPDVPRLEGATKADASIPLGARLLIRAAMQGKVNFIAYTTGKSPREVQDFYSKERMKAAGWDTGEKGCVGDTDEKENQGAVCFFEREGDGRKEGLAIVLAQDEKSRQTDIFYARADLTEATKPSP